MNGINCQLIVCILVGLVLFVSTSMFKNRIYNYLVRAGYT